MSNVPNWPCPNNCLSWCRVPPPLHGNPEPDTSHHPRCEYVAEERAALGGKQVIFFINDHDFGEGSLAHCRKTAKQWFDAFLENLDDGDEIEVTFKRQDMTKAELDALPEI